MIAKITLLKTLLTPAFMLGMRSQKNYMGFIPRKLVDWAKAQLCLLKTPDINVGVTIQFKMHDTVRFRKFQKEYL